ncbi:hypothetical protein ACHAXA_011830 [Cyclostephanos tholiformis]|uniref:Uncharacterized protein n=1 Tax=Cyclostephanos tholiformis TaxID=382380 RepID=A0ABD3RWG6_9STRA
MLNDEVDCTDGATGYVVGGDVYCVVTEENWSDAGDDNVGLMDIVDDDATNEANLGLLILEGEDCHGGCNDDDDDEEGRGGGRCHDVKAEEEDNRPGNESTSLSIPATLFLPSEIRSVIASGVTNEQGGNNGGDTFVARVQTAGRFGPFDMAHMAVIVVIFASSLSLGLWRTRVWENEAIRLRGELRRTNSLLPFTLALLKERGALLEKQGQLEEAIERALRMDSGTPSPEDAFPPVQSDKDKILSIKTCYIEATISLGQCSKEWQEWWHKAPNGSDTKLEDSHDSENGDAFIGDLNSDGIVGRFDRVLSKLINGCESCADDVTSNLSLWNW